VDVVSYVIVSNSYQCLRTENVSQACGYLAIIVTRVDF